jgi:hypothetical protein
MAESAPADMLLYGCLSQTSKAGPSHAAAWTVRSVLGCFEEMPRRRDRDGIVSPYIGRSATAAQWVHADVESGCSVNPRLIGAALAEAQHFHHWRLP